MSNASQAQAQAPPAAGRIELPGENLSLQETLRVMDVAREMRHQRETAEEMFRRDDIRKNLRDKLVRQAKLSGDNVSEDEVDAAIQIYLDNLHTYEDPPAGFHNFVAHCWILRDKILMGAASAAVVAGGIWYFFM